MSRTPTVNPRAFARLPDEFGVSSRYVGVVWVELWPSGGCSNSSSQMHIPLCST